MKNIFTFLILLAFLLPACSPAGNSKAERMDTETSELPAKAPQERTEALDDRRTEWSQSTYAEKPAPDSLVKKITDTIQ